MMPIDRLVSVTWAGSPAERVEPVTLDEAKRQLRVTSTSEDALIGGYIAAARALFEDVAGRQTIDAILEYTCYPSVRCLELPRPPLVEVISLVSRDTAGAETTLDPESYRVVLSGVAEGSPAVLALDPFCPPGQIEWPYGGMWPMGELRVRRRCGYGPTAAHVPAVIKSALYFLIGHFYRNRSEVTAETVQQIPLGAELLLRSFKYAGLVAR